MASRGLLGGYCSFCGKTAMQVRRLAGVLERPTRICDECIGLCVDILAERGHADRRPQPRRVLMTPGSSREGDLRALLAREPGPDADRMREAVEQIRRLLDGVPRETPRRFACSLCDAGRRDVVQLISGPGVFADGAALCANVLVGV